jgi:hypothetical protein
MCHTFTTDCVVIVWILDFWMIHNSTKNINNSAVRKLQIVGETWKYKNFDVASKGPLYTGKDCSKLFNNSVLYSYLNDTVVVFIPQSTRYQCRFYNDCP